MVSKMIKRKDNYYELTAKQKAFVDTLVEYPDATSVKQAEIASKKLYGHETVSRTYKYHVRDQLGNIIEQQREMRYNDRDERKELTERGPIQSESFDEILKSDGEEGGLDKNGGIKLEIELMPEDVERIVGGDVPDRLRQDIVSRLVDQNF